MKQETSSSEKAIEKKKAGGQSRKLEKRPEQTVMEALAEQGVFPEDSCGGKGRCGRCRVRYLNAAPVPAATERRFFSAEELRAGMRLACLHKVTRECEVEPSYVQPVKLQIVEDAFPVRKEEVQPDCSGEEKDSAQWCVAVDLGTTTIVMQARRLADGKALSVQKMMNPQRRFGSDVISRMQAAGGGQKEILQKCLGDVLEAGIGRLRMDVSVQNPELDRKESGIFLAGNTVMEHLLAGLSTEGLSRHPFVPVTLEEQKIRLGSEDVVLLPGFSAFVGADLLAGVLACRMQQREEISLLIDLGTNGEIVLGNGEKLLCTATAAGPAFEGGPGNPAPGTDMIAVIAELMDAGIVDETGLMAEPWFETGVRWNPGTKSGCRDREGSADGLQNIKKGEKAPVHMTQEQIRAVQMAKAAVYAGICVLVKEYGIGLEDIADVYLAGGFGYYLDVSKAARIGLFPKELTGRVKAVGNTSLAGAFLYGRNNGREEAAQVKKICRAINLAEHCDFQTIYLEHLNLE